MKKLLIMLLCCLILAGCSQKLPEAETTPTDMPASTETTHPSQLEETEAMPTEQEQTETEPSDQQFTFTVYTPNQNLDGFITTSVTAKEPYVVESLMAAGVLNETIAANSVSRDGTVLYVDMNSAFADLIYTQGTTGERMIMGSLVNTFLSAYGAESVMLTVDGKTLESGHVVYDFPMSFFE